MNTIETTSKVYTGNIGFGTKRHIIRVDEDADGNFRGRVRAVCSDAFRWDGSQQPTRIKKEMPSLSNIDCKKCRALI